MMTATEYQTPFGPGMVVTRGERILMIALPGAKLPGEFSEARRTSHHPAAEALAAAFDGEPMAGWLFEALEWPEAAPAFRLRVWKTCYRIPAGSVWTYGQLAAAAGNPGAARAAGSAMATNPFPLVVPCHRVVREGGAIGHYGGGAEMKRWLLEHEGALAPA